MPTITQLEYVLAVDKHRHFANAAKSCNISQPTLSQQIQKLEDELNIVIFDRVQKPILLTEEGQRFVEQARVVMKEHQRLLHVTKSGAEGIHGEFHLAVIPTVASFLLPLFLEDFSKNFPTVELYIDELKTETILSELRNDRLDGAIMATPLREAGLKEHPLFFEPMYLYLSEGHPLLKKESLSGKDLDAAEMWQLKDGNCFKDQVATYCSLGGEIETVFRNVHFQSGSLDTLRNIVHKTKGYTMIPALMTEHMSKAEFKKHVRPFDKPIPTREISFVYRRDHWKLEMIEAIKQSILKCVPDHVARQREKSHRVLELC